MNITNDEKQINTKLIKSYALQYGSVSIVLHIALVVILCSSALFVNDKIIDDDGSSAIKAVMVDLQIAAPKQRLVEDTPEISGNKKLDDEEEEDNVKAKLRLPPPKTVEKSLVVKKEEKEKKKQKQTKQAVQQQVKQEVDSKNIAEHATASAIADNQKFTEHPSPIRRNHPKYPQRALDMHIEGYVRVKFDVNSDGETENIRIMESIPNNIFDREVMKAIKTWQYRHVAAKDLEIKIEFNHDQSINLDKP